MGNTTLPPTVGQAGAKAKQQPPPEADPPDVADPPPEADPPTNGRNGHAKKSGTPKPPIDADPEAEQRIIGAVMIDRTILDTADLAAADFHDGRLRDIYSIALSLPRDIAPGAYELAIEDELVRRGAMSADSFAETIAGCHAVSSAAGVVFDIRCVKRLAEKRRPLEALEAAAACIRSGNRPPSPLVTAIVNQARTGASPGPHDDDAAPIRDGWPEPNAAIFHGVTGEFCRMADPHTEADPVALAVQFLAGFGNMVGPGPHFKVGATRHPLRLFVALVGQTSDGRKGSSLDVVEWGLEDVEPDWRRGCFASGLSSGEGLKFRVRDPTHDKDGNVLDPGVDDKRLFVVETEFGSTIKAMNRNGNTLSDTIRQAWDRSDFTSLTKHDRIEATNHHISLICHVTFEDIRKLLGETESANGFGNRFLWVASRSSKDLPSGGDLDSVDRSDLAARLRGLASWAKGIKKMSRDPAAEKAWADIYTTTKEVRPGLMGAMLGRAPAQIMRLACIYALLDGCAVVGVAHLAAASAVWNYCEASALLAFGGHLGDPAAEKLLDAIRAAPDGLTRTEISRDVFKGNTKAEDLDRILGRLFTFGMIHKAAKPGPGKPGPKSERWRIGRAPRNGP